MDKIRNIMNPGKSKDDEVMYGSGQSSDPVHAGTGTQATSSHNTNNPLTSSTADMPSSTREPVGQGGIGSIQQGSNPTSSSRMPGMSDDDAGSALSIKSGQPGNSQQSKVTGLPDTHDPLNTNKALPREPTTGPTTGLGSSTASGAGPHSSALGNKVDPRVDSDLDGSRGIGGSGAAGMSSGMSSGMAGSNLADRTVGNTGSATDSGRSFPLGGASSGATTSGPYTSNIANKADPRVDSDRDGSAGLGSTSGYASGIGNTSGHAHQGDLSRSGQGGISGPETGVATGAATGVPLPKGYGPESWGHDHNKHGHEYAGDPCENEPPAPGAPHFTSGPHSLDTANRLDPHVAGTTSGLEHATIDSTPLTGDHQAGTGGPASGSAPGAAGVGSYESSRGTPTTSTTLQDTTNTGPHNSALLNKADPRVDSDLSRQQNTSTTSGTSGLGGSSTTEPTTSREHHHGRDAALVGAGAGVGGAAAYGAGQHSTQNVPEGTSSSGYSNPYPPSSTGTGLGSEPQPSTTGYSSLSGPTSSTSAPSATIDQTSASAERTGGTDPLTTSKDHHHGRDAGLAGAGAGAGLGSAYEANKHLGRSHADTTTERSIEHSTQQPIASSGTADPSSTSRDHHYGRDVGLAGAGAGAAYEANKHLGSSHGDPATRGPSDSSAAQQPLAGSSRPDYGRDTDLASAGTTGHHESRHQPTTASALSGQPASRYDEPSRTGESHTGRNAALGAGAGAAALAGEEELSRKDLEREQKAAHKEELKEQKAVHKQELKEEKHHQHELDKAEKKHEKALAKEEAKHHHKDEPRKEETHEGEKKHHGLFGFLHRDKPDKELKEEEAARKEGLEHPSADTAAGVGGGVAGAAGMSEMEKHQLAKEHDRNRLHKDPPPGYGETRYAEEPKSGYASQVTGGTGTTALAQGDPVARGSHATGLGNKTDPSVTGRGETVDSDRTRDGQGRIVEPQTGLPIDMSKGDGSGGTDSTPVHGYHPDGSSTTGSTGGTSTGGGFGHIQDQPR